MRVWLTTVLATVGRAGRDAFNRILVERLQADGVPAALKVAWNEQIALLIGG